MDIIKKHTLFIGLNDKDSKLQEITTLDAYKIINRVIIGVGYDGCTISESMGIFKHESGEVVFEKSLRVEILYSEDKKTMDAIKQLKTLLNQESIGLQVEQVTSQFI